MSKSCHRIFNEYLINFNFKTYNNVSIINIEKWLTVFGFLFHLMKIFVDAQLKILGPLIGNLS
jgi:hypothetical protein